VSISIRIARIEDAQDIQQRIGELAEERAFILRTEPPPLKAIEAAINGSTPYVVADDGGTTVGFLAMMKGTRPGTQHTGGLFMGVLRNRRREGIGRALVEAGLDACSAIGMWRIELEVFSSNTAAIGLYKEFGFCEEGLEPRGRVLPDRTDDFLRMATLLAAQPPARGGPPDVDLPSRKQADGLTLKQTTLSDARALRRVIKGVANERRWISMLDAPELKKLRAFMKHGLEVGDPSVVAKCGATVVGWADVTRIQREGRTHAGYLGMGVDAAYRGQGVGRAVLEYVINASRAAGLLQIELGVWASNTAARKMYEGAGFIQTSRAQRYRVLDDFEDDLVFMQLPLDESRT
jgi:ribosomal protein S18 acetylase RimI-like enzyme